MTQTDWKQGTQGVIEVRQEEIDDFELQVKRFRAGEWDETEFQAFRLKQGIYGQRQADAQMVRVKVPFGGLYADQLDALGVVAEKYAPLNKGHATTRENFQFHHVKIDDAPDFMRVIGDAGLTTREACGKHRPQRYGLPLGGRLRRRAVRRYALRRGLRPILRAPPVHAGVAAEVQDSLLRVRARLAPSPPYTTWGSFRRS